MHFWSSQGNAIKIQIATLYLAKTENRQETKEALEDSHLMHSMDYMDRKDQKML